MCLKSQNLIFSSVKDQLTELLAMGLPPFSAKKTPVPMPIFMNLKKGKSVHR